MKLREITAGFVYDRSGRPIMVGDAKLRALYRLLRGPIRNEQVVVWTQFKEEFLNIQRAFEAWNVSCVPLTGDNKESRYNLNLFKRQRVRALVSHPRTASHGLRLENSHHTIYMSLDYDPDTFNQSKTRTWRPPQKDDCNYWVVYCPGTIDEQIYESLRRKTAWHEFNRKVLGE